ncbi:MAG: NAD-dependent epimerase/dehydratase family protein [Candidatus Omnitrophica bacterium]|nr:NAD-dependent epimerase/dehydratase family protein [Candidatus Omnitrophota bacterium]
MSKFLVAGGAGFIGSNITDFLLSQGHSVRVLDNFCSGKEKNLEKALAAGPDRFTLIKGDIRDIPTVEKAVDGVDYVLLLAALRTVPKSFEDPYEYNDVNINGVLTILRAATKFKVKRVVFSSSSSVYGDVKVFPQVETLPSNLLSPYALSKLAGEYYCKIFTETYGLETVCLRYFNIFGPRQALDDDYAVVIPKFIDCIRKDQPCPIFGDGLQSRDFTYIDNVVSANYLSAITPGVKFGIFNVACGSNITILHLVEALNKIFGKNIAPAFKPVRAGDIYKSHADISLISSKLGYKPLVDFDEGLKRTVEYFRGLQQ